MYVCMYLCMNACNYEYSIPVINKLSSNKTLGSSYSQLGVGGKERYGDGCVVIHAVICRVLLWRQPN